MDSGDKVKNTFILSARIKSGACHKNQRNTNIKRPAMRLAASSLIETSSPAPTVLTKRPRQLVSNLWPVARLRVPIE